MIDIDPKFYLASSPPLAIDQDHGLRNFMLKFLRSDSFLTLWFIQIIFGMMIDVGPKFYLAPSPPLAMVYRSRSRN